MVSKALGYEKNFFMAFDYYKIKISMITNF